MNWSKVDWKSREGRQKFLDWSVGELELSVRSHHGLERGNIRTIGDLIQKSEAELLAIPKFGRKSLYEIREVLHNFNMDIGTSRTEIDGWLDS